MSYCHHGHLTKCQEEFIIQEIIRRTGCCSGPKGRSIEFLSGSGIPSPTLGEYGDIYLDVVTGNLYKKDNTGWVFVTNLEGAKGDKGDQGLNFISDDGVPSPLIGNDGDTYLDLLTDDIYTKVAGVWILQTNIQGDKGDKGDKGDTGPGQGDAFGFSATTSFTALNIFPQGNTIIDPLIPTNLTGQYYNISGTIAPLTGIVTITEAGYWYIQQTVLLSNGDPLSYVSGFNLRFTDSLNVVIYDILYDSISSSLDGFLGGSRNLFLLPGTYKFAATITVSGGGLPLFPASQYPIFYYGVHLFSPQSVP